jgi:ABC-type lipoprotein export system ATPase subunit
MKAKTLIELRDVSKIYGEEETEIHALDHVDLEMEKVPY